MRGIFLRTGLIFLSLRVCTADLSYTISTVAGSDTVGDGGPATEAILLQAEGIAVDPSGNVYVSDALGHRVRKISPTGVIRTVAGTGQRGYSGDGGPATSAELNAPYGLAVDRAGTLYIADLGNARVRRVSPDGTIVTLAAAPLRAPRNLALDSRGALYISDFEGHRVYRFLDGRLEEVAGTGSLGFSGEGGLATNAPVGFPAGLAVDPRDDSVYIGDTYNHAIRKVTRGLITSIARITTPTGMSIDAAGALFVADPVSGVVFRIPQSGQPSVIETVARDVAISPDGAVFFAAVSVVRRMLPSGILSTFAGGGSLPNGDGGPASAARLNFPVGVAVDRAGNVYIADRDHHRIRKVSLDGSIATIAGLGRPGDSGDGALASQATLNQPSSISVDAAGNLYIADTGNRRVRRINPQGQILAVASTERPVHAIADAAGVVFISDETGRILRASGNSVTVLAEGLKGPKGLALDGSGNLYFADADSARVRKLSPDLSLTDLAPGAWKSPRGVAVDEQGNVFVADSGRQQVVRLDLQGRAEAVAGIGAAGWSGDGDRATLARLNQPWDIALGPSGTLYVAEAGSHRVRQLKPAVVAQTGSVVLADIVNAASGIAGPLAPGMLAAIRGSGIQPGEIPQSQFLFAGRPGDFVSIDHEKILVMVPDDLPSPASIPVQVRHRGLTRLEIPAVSEPAAPALFAAGGLVLASNEDGTANSAANPARGGSVVAIYGTGLGRPGLDVAARVGDRVAEVTYAGSAGSYPGVFQVNLRVPTELIPGKQTLVLKVAQAATQQDTAIFVQLP